MVGWHQFFITCNFNQWHGHGIIASGCYHDAILFLCNKIGTGSTKTGGQQSVSLLHKELHRGKNQLQVTILGANPSAVKSHMFGLDYILAGKRK